MKFDLGNMGNTTVDRDLVSRLNRGERFVIQFASRLAVDEDCLQVRVYIGDMMTARAVFEDGKGLLFFNLIDLAGVDICETREGICLVDFASWNTAAFGKQFAGVMEEREDKHDLQVVRNMINDQRSPYLWLLRDCGFACLLYFDMKDQTYRVIRTWIDIFNDKCPLNLDEAIAGLGNVQLKKLVDQYPQTGEGVFERIQVSNLIRRLLL